VIGILALLPLGATLGLVCVFELVVPRRISEEIVDGRWHVVRRHVVDAPDRLIAILFISRPQLQTYAASPKR
jgi:hypothetical protein